VIRFSRFRRGDRSDPIASITDGLLSSSPSGCNNRVYRLTPPQNYNIQSIVGAPHLAFEGRMGVRWKGGVWELGKKAN